MLVLMESTFAPAGSVTRHSVTLSATLLILLDVQNGHMWCQSDMRYTRRFVSDALDDTMCSDDPNTVIIKTDAVNAISDLQLGSDGTGSVLVEAGVTFPQL